MGKCTAYYYNGGASTSATKNNLRYRGYYYDTDLGLYYLQSRYYDANTYRFISPDAIMSGANGSLHGLNLYVYCFNNPINMTDSQGNWPTWNEFWNEAKRIVIGVLEAYVKAVEYEIGIGQGLGADAQSAALTGYRNTYISFDNGEFTAGNKFLTSIKIAGFGISYEANHKTYAGGKTLKTSAHNSDGPLAMLNYSETEKAHVISFSILDINLKNGELKYTTGSSAHILFGVHYSAGFSITEFIRGVIDIWK